MKEVLWKFTSGSSMRAEDQLLESINSKLWGNKVCADKVKELWENAVNITNIF